MVLQVQVGIATKVTVFGVCACLPVYLIFSTIAVVNQNALKINKVPILLLMIYNARNNFA